MSTGIKDRVAVIGTGKTRFGDNFELTYPDMALAATKEALAESRLELKDIQAVWLGTFQPSIDGNWGISGATVTDVLGLRDLPVSRCANYCATGTDAFRNACFAVASGQYDRVLVLGVEKMRDVAPRDSLVRLVALAGHPAFNKGLTAPGMFALHASRYFHTYGIGREQLAKVAVKNHYHGSLNPLAHFRKEVTIEQVLSAPMICWPLGIFDCTPTTDGAAAVIITSPQTARAMGTGHVLVKGMGLSVGCGDYTYFDRRESCLNFPATQNAARMAYAEAGITDPRHEISLAEVHDCFTITEILNVEDLGFAKPGEGWKLVEEGVTRLGRSPDHRG